MKKLKQTGPIVCIVLLLILAILNIIIAFTNPDLTQTQLAIKMWWTYPIGFILIIIYHWLNV